MKKTILTIGLFSLMMVLTSFTSKEVSKLATTNEIGDVGGVTRRIGDVGGVTRRIGDVGGVTRRIGDVGGVTRR
jgi:hypothetical protein